MASSLIPWRSCEVRIWRARTIGTSWTRFGQHGFLGDIYLIARYGERDDWDETRMAYRTNSTGRTLYVSPAEIDWNGFFEAFSAVYPALAARWQSEANPLRKAA